ncbi:MAG: flagellar biosynthetic protein FliP [Planctomycetota bacterium]|jgi:flagellar biosynthetic protein FliP
MIHLHALALSAISQLPIEGGLREIVADIGEATVGATETAGQMTTAVEIAILLTVLSVLPALVITMTSFTRIVIVLSFVRRAMGINELPPNPILIGLAMFLTSFVMAPVVERVYQDAWVPYRAGELEMADAGGAAWEHMGGFLLANTRESELAFFADLAGVEPFAGGVESPKADLPITVMIPAFVLSELKTAFQMGFLLFLPFLVIDMIVASVLLSMGMFMLPPIMISTPFKILLFVLVDGWSLICQSVVESFVIL